MVLVSGRLGSSQSEYVTEVEDGRKIIVESSDADGPLQWAVYDPSGIVERYGVDAAGRVEGSRIRGIRTTNPPTTSTMTSGTGRLRWLRETTVDRFGNGIQYQYKVMDAAGVERLLTRITYTTQTDPRAPAPSRSIDFEYEKRTPAAISYINGLRLSQSYLLKKIQMNGPADGGGGPIYRIYTLAYGTGMSGEPLLSSVSECDQASICKKPVLFSWTTSAFNLQSPYLDVDTGLTLHGGSSSAHQMNDWERIHVGDFDGDGADDLMILDSRDAVNTGSRWKIYQSRFGPHGLNGFRAPADGYLETAIITSGPGNSLANVVLPFEASTRILDTDLDGLSDVFHMVIAPNPLGAWDGRYQSCKTSIVNEQPQIACSHTESAFSTPWFSNAFLGDFDGDDHIDLLRQFGDPNRTSVGDTSWASSVVAGAPYTYSLLTNLLSAPLSNSFVAELDGDHRSEMIVPEVTPRPSNPSQFDATGWYYGFHIVGGAGTQVQMNLPTEYIYQKNANDLCAKHILGDFTGDGLTDSVVVNCQTDPSLFINAGDGFITARPVSVGGNGVIARPKYVDPKATAFNNGIRALDVNGDGRHDLLYTYTGGSGVRALIARADGSFSAMQVWATNSAGQTYQIPEGDHSETGPTVTQVFDANGDGAMDFFQFVNGRLHVYLAQNAQVDFLAGVSQEGGMQSISVTYVSSNDHAYVGGYNLGTIALPLRDSHAVGLSIVRQLTVREGGGSAITEHHTFDLPLSDMHEGWLGFARHTMIQGNLTTVTQFSQARSGPPTLPFPTLGMPLITTTTGVVDSANHTLVREERREPEVIAGRVPGSTVRVRTISTSESLSKSTVGSPTTTQIYYTVTKYTKFDPYDHVMESRSIFETTLGTEQTDITTSTYDNYTSGNDWMLGLRTGTCTTSTAKSGQSMTRCDAASYDAQTGFKRTVTVQPQAPTQFLETTFIPDTYGNIVEVERRDSFGHLRTDHTGYDADFVYPELKRNALNQTETIDTQAGFGIPLSTTDVNGLTTAYTYDGFGRTKSTTESTGEVISIKYDDGHLFPGQGIASVITESRASRSGKTIVAIDGFGREVFSEAPGFNQTLRWEKNMTQHLDGSRYSAAPCLRPARVRMSQSIATRLVAR